MVTTRYAISRLWSSKRMDNACSVAMRHHHRVVRHFPKGRQAQTVHAVLFCLSVHEHGGGPTHRLLQSPTDPWGLTSCLSGAPSSLSFSAIASLQSIQISYTKDLCTNTMSLKSEAGGGRQGSKDGLLLLVDGPKTAFLLPLPLMAEPIGREASYASSHESVWLSRPSDLYIDKLWYVSNDSEFHHECIHLTQILALFKRRLLVRHR
jgi:hypothetical protein